MHNPAPAPDLNHLPNPNLHLALSLIFALASLLPNQSAFSQGTKTQPSGVAAQLRFSFSRAPWQDVLQWLAKNADLSLHVAELPTGSFTYSDPRSYTPDEAIDRINMFLIPQRYSLVRSHKLLSVIGLNDEASLRQLDAIAQLVHPGELPARNAGEVVKCLFPLGVVAPEQALQELTGLLLIREPVLLRNSNQILVTDTAAKLLGVQRVLERLAQHADPAEAVKVFDLQSLDPERVLAQLRPHVGLEPLAMTGSGINFSLDAASHRLFVSGSKEKLRTAEGVLNMILSNAAQAPDRVRTTFRTHSLAGADLQTVVSVLQTLLADDDVRLAPDAASNQIALLATDDIHALVNKTIAQLANTDTVEFKTIPLGSLDLRQALTLLNGMFGGAAGAPRIDADPQTGRLLVRAKSSQIAEIQRILDQLHPTRSPDAQFDPRAITPRLAVFYLEHSTATDADRLLRRLLNASSGEGLSSPPPPLALSSPLSASTAWSFNTATIIADTRLNRIFAYGNAADLTEIERHLQIVDRESSMAEVRTHGAPRVIQLHHAKAADIAAVIRDAYAGRVAATATERREIALQAQRQQQNAPGNRDPAATATLLTAPADASDPPRMTLATDIPNNSLIVTAPLQLADEVQRLALTLDRQMQQVNEASAEVVRVIPSRNAQYIHTALKKLQGETVPESKPPSAAPSPARPPARPTTTRTPR